jgi:hypothetical protein
MPAKGMKVSKSKELVEVVVVAVENVPSSIVVAELEGVGKKGNEGSKQSHVSSKWLLYKFPFYTLHKPPARPLCVYLTPLDPSNELRSLHADTLALVLDLHLHPVFQLPSLLLHSDKTLLQLIATENDGKRCLFPFTCCELRRNFGLSFR